MKTKKLVQKAGIILLMTLSCGALFAAGVADELVDTGGLTLSPTVSYDSATLRISSDSSELTSSFSAGEAIRFDAGSLSDGPYHYELSLSNVKAVDDGSGASTAVTQNGQFSVSDGVASEESDDITNTKAEKEAIVAEQVSAANAVISAKNND